ncbi:TVP38/TMEM64 family protein [Microbulbifer sp. THAF38]|uniref:TVP38/TMEM64 family protein n=1 Tax=Microbulbifer sp. THAF38 TaxID=2587856 RepID=UPI0012692C8A|nr:TVP38/TMEM64 family protein [Microbulbifer sp. THAF38]QFT54675.1 TVP38/TMEM64 family inner membrane protein YdjZ [Microbulbifer sp. THAF38]
MAAKFLPVIVILICLIAVAGALSLLHYFNLDEQLIELFQWLNDRGWQTSLLFVLIVALAIVLLLPGIIFTMGAGFVFGVVKGTLLVLAGTVLGATLAFLIARYLLGEKPSRWIMSHIKPATVGEVIRREGWQMIMLTRLVPLFPFKLSNYFFGLTPVRLRDFVLGNALGVIPLTLNNVYVGSIAADLTSLGEVEERTTAQWALYIMGFVLAVLALIGLTRMARRALKKIVKEEDL